MLRLSVNLHGTNQHTEIHSEELSLQQTCFEEYWSHLACHYARFHPFRVTLTTWPEHWFPHEMYAFLEHMYL